MLSESSYRGSYSEGVFSNFYRFSSNKSLSPEFEQGEC